MSTKTSFSGNASTKNNPVRKIAGFLFFAVAGLALSFIFLGRTSAFAEEATLVLPASASRPAPAGVTAPAQVSPVQAVPVDPTLTQARISYQGGAGMIKGKADSDWSYATVNAVVAPGDYLWVDSQGTMEVEVVKGTYLRMADGSKAEIVSLSPSLDIRGGVGSFFVQRVLTSTGDADFETPVGHVQVWPGSDVRVDILDNGGTTVSTRWGEAVIKTQGDSDVTVPQGQRSYVDPGYLPSKPEPFDRAAEDPFDTWNHTRARLILAADGKIPAASGVPPGTMGVADLAAYGDWVDYNGQEYWHPTVDGYLPYRDGYWDYLPDNGYCWVDDYPFGYTTGHYGRWCYDPGQYGWLWDWQPDWGLGWCATLSCGDDFVWCPLDPWNQPCWGGFGDSFLLGGCQFGFGACSYCGIDDLRSGRCSVNAFDRGVFDHGHHDFGIFSLNGRGGHLLNFAGNNLPVSNIQPNRFFRGRGSFAGLGVGAAANVARLERGTHFGAASGTITHAGLRTPVTANSRSAMLKTTQINPAIMSNTRQIADRVWATPNFTAGRRGTGAIGTTMPRATSAGMGASHGLVSTALGSRSSITAPLPRGQRGIASSITPTRPQVTTAPFAGGMQAVPSWNAPRSYNVAPRTPSYSYSAPRAPGISVPQSAPSFSMPTFRSAPTPSFHSVPMNLGVGSAAVAVGSLAVVLAAADFTVAAEGDDRLPLERIAPPVTDHV